CRHRERFAVRWRHVLRRRVYPARWRSRPMSSQRIRNPRSRIVAPALLAAMVLATAAPSVNATPPGVNGRIAFMRGDTGHWQVWVANPDLSHATQITNEDADTGFAVWSPDGKRL